MVEIQEGLITHSVTCKRTLRFLFIQTVRTIAKEERVKDGEEEMVMVALRSRIFIKDSST